MEQLRPANCPELPPDLDQRLVVEVLAELVARGIGGAGEVLIDHVATGTEYDDAIFVVSQASGNLYRRLPAAIEGRFDDADRREIVRRWRYEIPWEELAKGRRWIADALEPSDSGRSRSADKVDDSQPMETCVSLVVG